MKDQNTSERSIVIVGSGGCGKTCMLHRLINNQFLEKYIPTVFEDSIWQCRLSQLKLKDTAGQEEYEQLIGLSITGSDAIIFCYAVNLPKSFTDIKNKFLHIALENGSPDLKIFLVATKTDLRDGAAITKEDGHRLAKEINAVAFYECSAKTGENVEHVFEAVGAHLQIENSKTGWAQSFMNFLGCSSCFKDSEVEPN